MAAEDVQFSGVKLVMKKEGKRGGSSGQDERATQCCSLHFDDDVFGMLDWFTKCQHLGSILK